MVNEIRYTSIHRVLDNLLDNPLLSDVSLEQAVRHTLRFIARFGFPKMYYDKIEDIRIHEFRGVMPCDLISIIQVRDRDTGICLRSMTNTFTPGLMPPPTLPPHKDLMNNVRDELHDITDGNAYIPERKGYREELSFKTQGRVIFTSFPEGVVTVAYKAIPVDDDGFPLLIDNEVYLDALELYIKKKVFTAKFEAGKLSAPVLENIKQEYAVAAKLLKSEFTTPSYSEMESITRLWNTMIPKMREFDNGFRDAGSREYLRKHNNRI